MNIVVDTSAIIAVIINEPSKPAIIQATQQANLLAPTSVHWEIANTFSAMFRRNRIRLDNALQAITIYQQIPIRFVDVELIESLQIASQLNLYAYDGYLLRCAQKYHAPLLSLDRTLQEAAEMMDVTTVVL